jgi:hypothetical protein
MTNMEVEMRSDGSIVVSWGSRVYVSPSDRPQRNWYEDGPRGAQRVSERRRRRLERLRRDRTADLHIHRFPRLPLRFLRLPIRRFSRRTAEDVAYYRRLRLITELEKEAIEWIGRGRPANIELGRRFTRLKGLVGHGRFRKYYDRKFGQPYQIAFRTAQAYMQLARNVDEEAKGPDPALFPLATDPQAVEIREATATHRAAVARAKRSRSEEDSSDGETDYCERAKDPDGSMCTCRLQIRMSKESHARVLALWRSEHRALAESAVTEFLLKLCAKYEIDGRASEESDE